MKMLGKFGVMAVSVMLLAAWATPVAPPQQFNMNFFGFLSGPGTADGTWSSTGSIDEVGGFTMAFSGSNTVRASLNLFGKQGSITVEGMLHQTAVNATDYTLTGNARITGGTGAYAGIKGHGSANLLVSGSGDVTGTISGVRTH